MNLDRTTAPPLADFQTPVSLHPEIISTGSGARLHILHNAIQPIVKIEFVFKAGKWYQPKAGVASLTAKMLMEGTITRDAKQLADIIDFFGASVDVTHGFDRSSLSLYCLAKFLPDLLVIVFEVLQEPGFREADLVMLKQRVTQTLSIDKQKNSYLSTELFTENLYGKDHPYCTKIEPEEINQILIEEIKDFHKKHYNLTSAEVFLTGDVDDSAKQAIIKVLESTVASSSITLTNAHINKGNSARLGTSNEMQASIRAGKSCISPSHADYPAFYLLNHAFGGYFGSRLMRNIREEKGFTYGIYSSISQKEHDTLFSIGTDIKGDKIEETLSEIKKETHSLQQTPISSIELETVKKHIIGKFLSDQATIFDIMDRYKSTVLLGLNPNFYTSLINAIQHLSAEDLRSAAVEHLQWDSLISVVAGGNVE